MYCVSCKNDMEVRKKFVVGEEECNQIFHGFHDSAHGGHCGTQKTKYAVTARFYWPGMGVDLDKWNYLIVLNSRLSLSIYFLAS